MIVTYNLKIDKLLKDVVTELHYYGLHPKFSLTDYVEGQGIRSNGFFDPDCREFACSLGKPQEKWLRTFVHESCHFDQWKEKCDEWRACDRLLPNEEDLLWDWLDNKVQIITSETTYLDPTIRVVDYAKLVEVAKTSKEIERDCEKRTIEKIQKYGLDISIEDYARGAWAYVLFYDYILEVKHWYKIGYEPYNNEDLKKLMPSNMIENPILTDDMRKLYAQCI